MARETSAGGGILGNLALGVALSAALLALTLPGRRAAAPDAPAAPYPDDGRGRSATSPAEITRAGWGDVLRRVWRESQEDRILTEAAGITFYTLLAIFPAIGALVSLYGLFADPATVGRTVDALRGIVPDGGLELIETELGRLAGQAERRLGIGFLLGLGISLWSANQGIKALFDALNVVYGERETRSFLRINLLGFAFTLGSLLFLMVALSAVVAVPVAGQVAGAEAVAETSLPLLRWPVMLAVIAAFLALVYRYGPCREPARWRWVSWGGIVAALLWVAVSAAFSWYVANFGNYNATYGSLGAVAGFMTWIWISAAVVLVGGELNAELEHQTARDSTTGPPEPIGRRGAKMADKVAPPERG